MKNAELVRRLPKLAELRREAAAAERSAQKAQRLAEKLDEEIDELARVSEVRDGIAITRYGGFIQAAGDEIRRCAEIYPNAHNNGATWGLHTYTDVSGRAGERWWGAGWKDEAQVEAAALAWIAHGTVPTHDGKPA